MYDSDGGRLASEESVPWHLKVVRAPGVGHASPCVVLLMTFENRLGRWLISFALPAQHCPEHHSVHMN